MYDIIPKTTGSRRPNEVHFEKRGPTAFPLIRPKAEQVTFNSTNITGLDASKVIRLGIGHVLEGMRVFSTLSVEDNLMLGAYGRKLVRPDSLQTVFKYFPILERKRRQLAGSLSGGEKQMLAIARTLMCELKLLLLDEPPAGLAPLLVKRLFEILSDLRKEYDLTILLVKQKVEIALGFADRGMVLAQGQIMLEGEAASLAKDPEVKRICLREGAVC
jgi:branched-chain amino acid transport system ATP-binding protein